MDAFGQRPRRGYAFVIRTGPGTSDLLTDYHLVVQGFMDGDRSVELQHNGQAFAATIVAVSPEPHVALLRMAGTYSAFAMSLTEPAPGDTVVVFGPPTQEHAAVLAYSGPGSTSHLAFSVEVPNVDDGAPVLDSTGKVVGMAEPTSQFAVSGIGFAVPIVAACRAVGAC